MTDQPTPQTEAGRLHVDRLVTINHFLRPSAERIVAEIEAQAHTEALDVVVAALTSEDEIAHGEAFEPSRGGLGVCAYCDRPWPCHTQQAIDRLLSRLAAKADR